MRAASKSRGVSKILVRPALWFCACNVLAAALAAQCTNPTQVPNGTYTSGDHSQVDNNALSAANVVLSGGATATYVAGNCIQLLPGFHASAIGATVPTTFHAWVETAPAAVSVSPSSGSGLAQPFTWTVSSPSGYSNLSDVYALFNTSVSGANACYIHYNRPSNLLYVADSSGSSWSSGIVPGSSGTTGNFNPYCTINANGSGFSGSGAQLQLTASVTFQTSFAGTKNEYLIGYDNQGLNTTWQQMGTWTVSNPSGFTPIRISSGGAYTDSLGQVWSADYGYLQGSTYSPNPLPAISGTADQKLYQTERYDQPSLTYQFSVPNGNYTVTLKFAEIFDTAAGQRYMNGTLNGTTVFTNLDVWTAAVGPNRAYDLSYPVSVTNGQLTITLTCTSSNNSAEVNSVQVVAGSAPQQYSLTTSVPTGGGSTNPSCPSGCLYTSGSQVQITATPNSGNQFSGFTGVDSSSGSVGYVTMNANRSVAANFTASPPNITGISPTSGTVGTQVTISGTGFGGSGTVSFNGTLASIVSWSATTVVAQVPAGATTGNISLSTGGYQTSYQQQQFQVTAIGVTVSPASATLGQGQNQQFAATVTGTTNQQVTWSVLPTGAWSISSTGLFTAPQTITALQAVTVTATSVAQISATGSATVTMSPSAPQYTISGTVVMAGSSTALPGVTVSLGGTTTASAQTRADGSYSFNVPAGAYTATVAMPGYGFVPGSWVNSGVSSNQAGVNFSGGPRAMRPLVASSGTPSYCSNSALAILNNGTAQTLAYCIGYVDYYGNFYCNPYDNGANTSNFSVSDSGVTASLAGSPSQCATGLPETFDVSFTAAPAAAPTWRTLSFTYSSSTITVADAAHIYDTTPIINGIAPNNPYAGSQTYVSIYGSNFGSAGSVQVCTNATGSCAVATGFSASTTAQYSYWSETQINVLLTSPSYSAGGTYYLQVGDSTDGSGTGFLGSSQESSGNQSNEAPFTPVAPPTMDGLQVSQPVTPDAAGGTTPAFVPVPAVTNTSSAFATATSSDLMVVLMGSGTVTIVANNIQPTTSANQVNWQMGRDPSDTVDTAVPALSASTGGQTTFQPSTPGNFQLIAWVDLNGDGQFNEGEQLRILRIAVVRATFQTQSIFLTRSNVLVAQGVSAVITGADGTVSTAAMVEGAIYLLEGGGATRTIGTAAITIGGVGNLVSDTFTVAYPVPSPTPQPPGNVAGTGTEMPGGSTPMIDTPNVTQGNQASGGKSPFRATQTPVATLPATPATGGLMVGIISADAPKFGWLYAHPTTQNVWGSTGGGNSFREYFVAFSSSFQQTYLPLNQASWSIAPTGNNSSGWVCAQCSVTGDSAFQSVSAQPQVQVQGMSFVSQHTVVYQ